MIRQVQSPKQSKHKQLPTLMTPVNLTIIKKEECEPSVEVYHQRKGMISEYKELFSALFRLPDKEMQQKVLRCINAKYRSIETQTDPVEIVDIAQKDETECNISNKLEIAKHDSISSPNDTCSEPPTTPKPETPKKRKRKRKVSLPQVNKESRVALAQKKQMAKMNNPQHQKRHSGTMNGRGCSEVKRSRLDSTLSVGSYLDCFDDDVYEQPDKMKITQNIIKECLLAEYILENGLLPIHESIVKNQLSNLKIQIFIWKDWKAFDLNDDNLLTDDDEDLLQLSIVHNCYPEIIHLLLASGLNPNSVDGQGNTPIHLAVLNNIHHTALQYLMQKIDLKMLLTLNDDGYTSLQLAIRQDCYLLAETILNMIDKQLSGNIFYYRQNDMLETDEKICKEQFQSYYEKVMLDMELDENGDGRIINNHDLKQKLLQALDMRSGNTALYFAIENQSEHLIYFLLAHLTDPRTENLSGQDCRSFFSEFGKSLNLSLNIDGAMEKVIKLLS